MTSMDKIFNVAALIVGVAAITAVVSGRNTAGVIRAAGEAFSGGIKAALGK